MTPTISASPAIPPPRRSLGLQGQILLLFGFVLAAILLITALLLYNSVTLTEQSLWQGRQNEAAEGAAARVADFVEDARRTLAVAAAAAPADAAPMLEALVAQNPALLEMVVVDERGTLLLSESPAPSLLVFETARATREWFIATRDAPDAVYISPLHYSIGGEPYLIMAQATREGGAVAVRVDMELLRDIVQGLRFGQSGTAYIVQADGRLLVHTDPSLVEGGATLAGQTDPALLINAAARSAEYTNFQGTQVLGAAAVVPQTQWYIVTELPDEEAFALSNNSIRTTAFITVLFFLIAAGVTLYGMRTLLFEPLQRLTEGAHAVRQGDLNTNVLVARNDEIGQVTVAFNRMVRGVAERTAEREELLGQLSQSVADLQVANRLAQESANVKSEFLATMSHELRTPMHAIEGFVGIMLNRMAGVDYNDKAQHYLQRINANSKRLLQLINDFLDLSRVEAGRLELARLPFSPSALAQRWHTELVGLAEQKGIAFDLTIDPALPPTLYGDEEAVSKVALNLLGNALKFTEQGKVSLALERDGGAWRIVVSDTGIGIPHHAREVIFEEFRQVDQSSRRKFGGTGLGLAIVQKYTRTMGGTVTLDGAPGRGSIFTVTLPLAAQEGKREGTAPLQTRADEVPAHADGVIATV